jgi:hypothetical protein
MQGTPGSAIVEIRGAHHRFATIKSQGRRNGKQSGYVAGMLSISGS